MAFAVQSLHISPFYAVAELGCILLLGRTPYFIKASLRAIMPVRVPFVMFGYAETSPAVDPRHQHSFFAVSRNLQKKGNYYEC